jgi:hypothetical protein
LDLRNALAAGEVVMSGRGELREEKRKLRPRHFANEFFQKEFMFQIEHFYSMKWCSTILLYFKNRSWRLQKSVAAPSGRFKITGKPSTANLSFHGKGFNRHNSLNQLFPSRVYDTFLILTNN